MLLSCLIDVQQPRGAQAFSDLLWGDGKDGRKRGFVYQLGDIIEEVFRPAARRQELLLQKIIVKLDGKK